MYRAMTICGAFLSLFVVANVAHADWFYRCVKDGVTWAGNSRTYGTSQRGMKGARCRFYRFGSREPEKTVPAKTVVGKVSAPEPASRTPPARTETASDTAKDLDAVIDRAATAHAIPRSLLRAVVMVESRFKPDVVSAAGAQGLMQLMPATADYLRVDDPFDPEQNVMGGAKLLRMLSDRYNGDVERVLAAYYAGPANLARAGGTPSGRAQGYVNMVMAMYRKYSAEENTGKR